MDRLLLEQNWNDGYPLCLETLRLLQNNVQIVEAVLNGLNLPQNTIVRFPAINGLYLAYVNPGQNVPNSLGRGEILRIGDGAELGASNVYSYSITATQYNITDSHEHEYEGVYEERRLNLQTAASIYFEGLKVYDFDKIVEKGMWVEKTAGGYRLQRNDTDTSSAFSVETGSIAIAKKNDKEIRIRICLNVENLTLGSDTEHRIIFNYTNHTFSDVFPIFACFNGTITGAYLNNGILTLGHQTIVNKHVPADVCGYSGNKMMVKILAYDLHELSGYSGDATFTGQITVNAVICL